MMEERLYKAGQHIGSYMVLEYLASGGLCAIYKAHDLKDAPGAAPLALKISRHDPKTLSRQERFALRERTLHEFSVMQQLEHRSIVPVIESGLHEGVAWYAMELLEGPTLGRYLAEKRRPYAELLPIYRQLVSAVAHCHEQGVVHRDLKPANIVVTFQVAPVVEPDEEDHDPPDIRNIATARVPVLLDFGIAQSVGARPLTGPGQVVGTIAHFSPTYVRALLSGALRTEAHRAEPDEDVYQLGWLLYLILTGQPPTRARGLMDLLFEIRDVPPPHPRALNPDAPAALSDLAMRCLEKSGEARPADSGELLWRLLAAQFEDRAELHWLAPEYLANDLPTLSNEARALFESLHGQGPRPAAEGKRKDRGSAWGGNLSSLLALVAFVTLLVQNQCAHKEPPPQAGTTAITVPETPGMTPRQLGGLELSRQYLPKQLRAPCLVDGQRMKGVVEVRGSCWWPMWNPTSPTGTPTRQPCVFPAYDPPPEDPDKGVCYLPVYPDKGAGSRPE